VSSYDLGSEQDREDRRKHLELVSAVVARMAAASAAAKGWSITVAGAAFGIAVVRSNWFIFLLGVIALVVFGIVDGLYLHSERKFRDLYNAIIAEDSTVRPFSMDPTGLIDRRKRDSHRSWSVLGFYGPLAIAGLVLMAVSMSTGDKQTDTSPRAPAQSSTTSSTAPLMPPIAPTAASPPIPTTAPTTPAATSPPAPTPPPGPASSVNGPTSSLTEGP
jgi:hypothetical protein